MASIKHLFHIAASKEQIYNAIATLDGLQSWWTTDATGESKPGGVIAFRFNGSGMDFKVTALEPHTKIGWECVAGFSDWMGTTVTFLLDENAGKTRVRFEHAGWQETGDNYAACCFSWARYMESLRQLCEKGVGRAFGSAQYA